MTENRKLIKDHRARLITLKNQKLLSYSSDRETEGILLYQPFFFSFLAFFNNEIITRHSLRNNCAVSVDALGKLYINATLQIMNDVIT